MPTFSTRDFPLASGAVLADMTVAYRTMGQLDADGANAVLVLHGYTTGPSMLDAGANVAEGSWSALVGPGRPIDSDRYFVICPNMLGSSYGSTGPASIDPASGKPYGAAFPRIVMGDIVRAQKLLLDALGVRRLAAVAGPSFGAFQALQWALDFPAMVERVVAAVGAPYFPNAQGATAATRAKLQAAPGWQAWCDSGAQQPMLDTLTAMRVHTLVTYGVDAELQPSIPDAAARAARIEALARHWAQDFNPGSLITLMDAAEQFDVRPQLTAIGAPVLFVLSRTDPVFSPALARELARLPGTEDWQYVELDSDKGHFASGADAHLWADTLRRFMAAAPGDMIAPRMPVSTTEEPA